MCTEAADLGPRAYYKSFVKPIESVPAHYEAPTGSSGRLLRLLSIIPIALSQRQDEIPSRVRRKTREGIEPK